MVALMLIILLIVLIVDFLICLSAGFILFFIIMVAYICHGIPLEEKLKQELHIAKGCKWKDDARESMQKISYFLWRGRERLIDKSEDFSSWEIPSGKDQDAVFFVHMCHVLGCEVVIRRVADHDIEEDPDNPELIKARNKVQRKKRV